MMDPLNIQLWKTMDLVESPPVRLTTDDLRYCHYTRDYISKGGYKASEANGLISNLKKALSTRGTYQWNYKIKAIQQFADELIYLLSGIDQPFHVAPLPTSKCRTDTEFDGRLDEVLRHVCAACPKAILARPIERKYTVQAAHESEERLNLEETYETLEWTGEGLKASSNWLIFVDDVITAGTLYKTCQRIVRERNPNASMNGVFWARTIWPDIYADVDISGLLE